MKLVIIIATLGRSSILAKTLADIRRQTRLPDEVIVIGTRLEDLPTSTEAFDFPVRILIGPIGTTNQRNTGIDAAKDSDILLFLDDDFVMASDFLARAEALFQQNPRIVAATGHVLLDGIHGPGISFAEALEKIECIKCRTDIEPPKPTYNAYGCNMLVRSDIVMRKNIRFDSRLPLYGWLEDVDFSRQIGKYGEIVWCDALRGIHLGAKAGRSSGRRFGYSQIANPLYLRKKQTMITWRAAAIMAKNLSANLVKSLRPEPEIDRRGRLAGNFLAIWDLLRGNLSPERVLDIK